MMIGFEPRSSSGQIDLWNGGSQSGGRPKILYQIVVKRHFSNEILGWIIDPDSKTGKNWHANHDPRTKAPKTGQDRPDTKHPKSGILIYLQRDRVLKIPMATIKTSIG
jgi:hypothetical protein